MDDEWLSRRLRKLSNHITGLTVALFISTAAVGGVSYLAWEKAQETQIILAEKGRQIDSLQHQMSELRKVASETDVPTVFVNPQLCSCVAKESNTRPKAVFCASKNETCDEESRALCNTLFDKYAC